MLTGGLILLCLWLAVCAGAAVLLWRAAAGEVRDQALLIRHQAERIDGYRAELDNLAAELDARTAELDNLAAELDALSIAGPLRVDTTTGSHDALPINEHNRQMLTDYVEGMWQHTQETP